jgi:GTP-binding protein
MFCDETEISIKSGDGGSGIVSFRRERFIDKGGPDGGDGGNGGSIFFETDNNLNTLSSFRTTKNIKAEPGANGGKKKMRGKKGVDLILKVPPGTVIYEKGSGQILADLNKEGQKVKLAQGGSGGFGNAHFTSSTRQTPSFSEYGEPGQIKKLRLELKLVADVGIIGLPNVGKSTLLSRISEARPKIADYPFTTLVPNLGIVNIDNFSFVACDIPGLIEGAYKGKGLGDKFLRHIERCRLLVHMIDVTSKDLVKDYKIINQELKKFSPKLAKKIQVPVINKIDTIENSKFPSLAKRSGAGKAQISKLKKMIGNHQPPINISAVSGKGIKELLYEVKNKLKKIPKEVKEIEQIKVFRPYEKLIKIEKKNNIFSIESPYLEKLVLKTDLNNDEAQARLYRILEVKGVLKLVAKKGANSGDKLKIAGKLITIN